MLKLFAFSFILLFSLAFSSFAQKDAKEASEIFLNGVKIIDLPEGKEIVSKMLFKDSKSFPVISSYETLYESYFDTDLDSLKGYKKVISAKASNKYGNQIEKRFILIMYEDLQDSVWKVFEFRESIDAEKEVSTLQKSITNHKPDELFFQELKIKYRGLSYWLLMVGKVNEAKIAAEKSIEEAQKTGDNNFSSSTIDVLDRIIPKG